MARQVLTPPDLPASYAGLVVNGPDLTDRFLRFQTAGVDRWRFGISDTEPEGAPDVGGDLVLRAVWQSGTEDVLRFDRDYGVATLASYDVAHPVTVDGPLQVRSSYTQALVVRGTDAGTNVDRWEVGSYQIKGFQNGYTQPFLQLNANGDGIQWRPGAPNPVTGLAQDGATGALLLSCGGSGGGLRPNYEDDLDLGTVARRWRSLYTRGVDTRPTGGTASGRLLHYYSDVELTLNASWNGSQWNRDATNQPAARLALEGGVLRFSTAPTGANPIGSWVDVLEAVQGRVATPFDLEGGNVYTDGDVSAYGNLSCSGTAYLDATEFWGPANPGQTNSYDLGTTALRFRKLWAVDADLATSLLIASKAVATSPDSGNALEWRSNGFYAGGGGGGSFSALRDEEFFPSAAATTVVLATAPTNIVSVARNGVIQSQTAGDFSLAASTLTFSTAFAAGERVAVVYEIGVAAGDLAYTKNDSDLRFVNVAGDDMTGLLTITPTGNTHGLHVRATTNNFGAAYFGASRAGSIYTWDNTFAGLAYNAIWTYGSGSVAAVNQPGHQLVMTFNGGLIFQTAPQVAAGVAQTWATRFSVDGTGQAIISGGAVAPSLNLDSDSGNRWLRFRRTDGTIRFQMATDGGSEDFYLYGYNNAMGNTGTLIFGRANGTLSINTSGAGATALIANGVVSVGNSVPAGGQVGIGLSNGMDALLTGYVRHGLNCLPQPNVQAGATSVQASGIHVGLGGTNAGGAVIANLYSLWIDGPNVSNSGTISHSSAIYVTNPNLGGALGNQYCIYNGNNGANLSTGGTWANAASWAAGKEDIRYLEDADVAPLVDWFTTGWRPARYRPLMRSLAGDDPDALVSATQASDYDSFFAVLDDMPQDVREVICVDEAGAISTKDMDGFLAALLQNALKRIAALEAANV